ncbi:hypothetical protein HPB51_008596 [Rhipicephalus microplus]|uniref:Peptidase M12B domain-containing protein n=1 Tax=Rhipicephalus microplus TaxID=6941 RepID=A0A9J6EMU7_RHIMP|nr:hypothetical protein HPB51_008596 [Rhipicephalus microplus]
MGLKVYQLLSGGDNFVPGRALCRGVALCTSHMRVPGQGYISVAGVGDGTRPGLVVSVGKTVTCPLRARSRRFRQLSVRGVKREVDGLRKRPSRPSRQPFVNPRTPGPRAPFENRMAAGDVCGVLQRPVAARLPRSTVMPTSLAVGVTLLLLFLQVGSCFAQVGDVSAEEQVQVFFEPDVLSVHVGGRRLYVPLRRRRAALESLFPGGAASVVNCTYEGRVYEQGVGTTGRAVVTGCPGDKRVHAFILTAKGEAFSVAPVAQRVGDAGDEIDVVAGHLVRRESPKSKFLTSWSKLSSRRRRWCAGNTDETRAKKADRKRLQRVGNTDETRAKETERKRRQRIANAAESSASPSLATSRKRRAPSVEAPARKRRVPPADLEATRKNDSIRNLSKTLLLRVRCRARRAAKTKAVVSSRERAIELAVFVDAALNNAMATERALQTKLTAILEQVQLILEYRSLGRPLKLEIVTLELVDSKRGPSTGGGDIDAYLDNFCVWQCNRNQLAARQGLGRWDHALMLSGLDLVKGNNSRVLGLAWVNGMCRCRYSCTLSEARSLEAALVVAHELGHSLGMHHDGPPDNRCDPDRFIMSAKTGAGKTGWSSCSGQYLEDFLSSRTSTCLASRTSQPVAELDGEPLPGQLFPADAQCKLALGTDYSAYTSSRSPFNASSACVVSSSTSFWSFFANE